MSLLVWILIFSAMGGLLSVLAASGFMLLSAKIRTRLLPGLVSIAIGTLLGAAFLALIPHAMESKGVDIHDISATLLLGVLAFFVLEKLVLWRHCHYDRCEAHAPDAHVHQPADVAAARLILIGDGVHNLVDGVLIAAAFMTDIHLGIVTAFAVIAHEIPQEMGDFAILLNGGMSRGRALVFNALSSVTTLIGAIITYFALAEAMAMVPYVLAIAAASFIYVAVADLIPGLHRRVSPGASLSQLGLIILGVLIIYFAHSGLH